MASTSTQDWTRTRIAPHGARLWRCLKGGVARFNKLSAEDRIAFNGRCQADVINAFIIDQARQEFEGIKGSDFTQKNNTTYHSLDGCVLWYKQLDATRMPSNIPTLTVDQMMQGQFDFMPDKLLVVVGFELDALKSSLKSVDIMRFGPGHRVEFVIELVEVVQQPRLVTMVNGTKTTKRKKTTIELRPGFEQKSLGSGEE